MNAVAIHSEDLPQVHQETAAVMAMISKAAADPAVDIEKLERLMAMKERMDAKASETEFNAALSRVQAKMGRISADAVNNQTRSTYATYGKLDAALRPIYTAEGLSLSFDSESAKDGFVGMICYVSHHSGHTRTYRAEVPSDGKGAKGNDVMTKTHAFGSGTSYGMRYLLKMIFNVAIGEEDDDGNQAGQQQRQQQSPTDSNERNQLYASVQSFAAKGIASLEKKWAEIGESGRKMIGSRGLAALKAEAEAADAEGAA